MNGPLDRVQAIHHQIKPEQLNAGLASAPLP
jgi:hypothetical protein